MKIEKHLEWAPSFDNQIDIEEGTFSIWLTKKEVEVMCSWDYRWGGRGTETMVIPLEVLKELIKEIEDSKSKSII